MIVCSSSALEEPWCCILFYHYYALLEFARPTKYYHPIANLPSFLDLSPVALPLSPTLLDSISRSLSAATSSFAIWSRSTAVEISCGGSEILRIARTIWPKTCYKGPTAQGSSNIPCWTTHHHESLSSTG